MSFLLDICMNLEGWHQLGTGLESVTVMSYICVQSTDCSGEVLRKDFLAKHLTKTCTIKTCFSLSPLFVLFLNF